MSSIQTRDVAEARTLAVTIEKQETVTNSLVSKVRVIITPVAENVDFENDFICSSTDWTKLQDGNGSVYKDFTENVSNFTVSLEYVSSTTIAYWYQYDGVVNITEIRQMRYTKINWKAPTKVKDAYATLVDGTEIPVTPAQYSGDTPISVQTLKYIDNAIEYLFQNCVNGESVVPEKIEYELYKNDMGTSDDFELTDNIEKYSGGYIEYKNGYGIYFRVDMPKNPSNKKIGLSTNYNGSNFVQWISSSVIFNGKNATFSNMFYQNMDEAGNCGTGSEKGLSILRVIGFKGE